MDSVFPYREEVESQLAEIKKIIRLSMNGIASEGMKHLGYKLNYGVSLPRIKELAGRFHKNHLLAQRLWFLEYRETMIMATILQPMELFSEQVAEKWAGQCMNMEIIEQCCRNLFVYLPYGNSLALKMLGDVDVYKKSFAYILYANLLMKDKEDNSILPFFIEKASENIYDNSAFIYSSVARFLKQLAKKEPDLVSGFLSKVELSVGKGSAWVCEEVKTSLYFKTSSSKC